MIQQPAFDILNVMPIFSQPAKLTAYLLATNGAVHINVALHVARPEKVLLDDYEMNKDVRF